MFYLWFPQLDKLVEKQRETYRRMLEQLLVVEQSHKQALYKLEDEKKNHGDFMKKSDEFTNLLEQERERSVRNGSLMTSISSSLFRGRSQNIKLPVSKENYKLGVHKSGE